MSEDETFRILSKTSYEEVWGRCREVLDGETPVEDLKRIKEECGWTEWEFSYEWHRRGEWQHTRIYVRG